MPQLNRRNPMRFGVVIPAFNEADFIGQTIRTLATQADANGDPYPQDDVEIVVVDTPGTDGTPEVVRAAAAEHPGAQVTVLRDEARSMVSARITGIEYLLGKPAGCPQYLISADADTLFPPTWLAGLDRLLVRGYEIVSACGCYEAAFWRRCPVLSRRYIENIGTIFFTQEASAELLRDDDAPLFTSDLFRWFGRPVSDCGFAISTRLYQQLGGFRHEFYDAEERAPILAVGWPLMFRADLAGIPVGFLSKPEYETSARRLLHEPDALFSGASYLGEIENFRSIANDQYSWMEHFAPQLDMEPLQRYVVKNYILQQCITRPERISASPQFFGDLMRQLTRDILEWRGARDRILTRDIFSFAEVLSDIYFDAIMQRVRSQAC